jgi:nickel/cobalt exporter
LGQISALRFLPLVLVGAVLATPAVAHPHIFIDAKLKIVFNEAGEVRSVENSWTFDEAFSAWQTSDLDVNQDGITSSEEMADLARENVEGLATYGFYTSAGEGDATLPLASMDDARFVYENGRSTFTFGLEPQAPYRIKNVFEVAVYDPEYYVAITIPDASAVTLENAPAGCEVSMRQPQEMSEELASKLYSLPPDMLTLPPDLAAELRGVQGAVLVTCPPIGDTSLPVAETAVDAATQVAEAKPAMPFGGPPPEPGLAMPRTGFLGWVNEQQRNFYRAMNEALSALKTDFNAFWVLGGLSFLYGVFHAAGPGHGKVVISSYVLANERQVRRGIVLSFASAMMQSVVAVVFVLVAALALNATSLAMADAANWIGIASYGLVALLGLWLIARKLFGWGHSHHHHEPVDLTQKAKASLHAGQGHALNRGQLDIASKFQQGPDAFGRQPGDPHYGHNHGQDDHHDHDHHHVVTADQVKGDWREQLGVVLGVGLRPCSGALVVLVFALSQGLLAAGIVAVFLMGLGTAITVAVLASVAVGAKGLARKLLGRRESLASGIIWWAELLGAMLVFTFGMILLLASL